MTTLLIKNMNRKIEFQFNKQKAIEAILYLANKRPSIDKMSLYKFLFFADIEHLNKYGRPIFGGYYVAMPLGPVPSQIKDLLEKENNSEFEIIEYMITATRTANTEYLSNSDMEVLDQIYGKFGNYSATQLSNLSHEHSAWINARKSNKLKNNNRLDYKDMIDACNSELIEDLEENSKYILI